MTPEIEALREERRGVKSRVLVIGAAIKEAIRAEIARRGWTQCCRCFPSAVSDAGFCSCCEWNHATGKSEAVPDPDPFAGAPSPPPGDYDIDE